MNRLGGLRDSQLKGNNVFGQWCYEEGCGIVPSRRISGATHEVRYFDTVEKSVESYFLNINTHDSYAYLRDLRFKMRALWPQVRSNVSVYRAWKIFATWSRLR